jgi:hypothetical protein
MNLKINNNKFNFRQTFAWLLFVVSLLVLLLHGLSSFVAKPKIETVTTNPSNTSTVSNSYMNQTQDVDFKNHSAKKR